MARRPPLTPEQRQRIRELYDQGMTRNAIAREMDVGGMQVTNAARDMGLVWGSSKGGANNRAAQEAEIANLRAKLRVGYAREAVVLMEEIHRPHIAFNFGGRDNTYNEQELSSPPSADKLKLMQASTLAAQQHIKLAELDEGAQVNIAKSFVIALGIALGIHPGTSTQVARTDPGAEPPTRLY